jgi:hypothetical protein
MNHPKSPNSQLLQFMLRAQQLARQDVNTDKGYAMMMTSIITIMLFSLMGAFLTMTNLAKSSTDAYIDGNNTFYAAESGLNRRAQELRARFENYNSPSDGATTVDEKTAAALNIPATISPCYSKPVISDTNRATSNDFECRNYPFKYNNNIARSVNNSGNTVLSEADNNTSTVNYTAFTFVSDKTNYDNATVRAPIPIVIADGTYKDLNAQEYKYTVNATAAKPNANVTGSQIGQSGENKTVLQMDFKSRTIPLFQFGAFYTRDLELNPSPTMDFNGRLHSNQKVYLTAGDSNTLSLNSIISAVNSINTGNPALLNTYSARGTVRIQTDSTSLEPLPATTSPTTAVPVLAATFTESQASTVSSTYKEKLKIAPTALRPPPIGFLTKADANRTDGIGEYYGKADLRLEMFPNRSVPFKLQAIKSGGTDANTTCNVAPFSTTTKVSKERAEYNKLECTDLNEGKLRSLMQPVLVRPRSPLESTIFCTNAGAGTQPKVGTAVNIGATNAITISTAPADLVIKERILDALYLTLSAQTTPVAYSTLTTNLLPSAQAQFRELLVKINIPGVTSTDLDTLAAQAPANIAALTTKTDDVNNIIQSSCFRPAPIQALFTPSDFSTAAGLPDNLELAKNKATNFYDRRENRYIRMLQTNIESLTLWNRDNIFTQGIFDEDLTTPNTNTTENITPAALAAKFTINDTTKAWIERPLSHTDDILFQRAASVTTALVYDAATGTYKDTVLDPSYRTMGLAAKDRTEGGLVFHATIDKATYPYLATSTTLDTDSLRQSPYGFAFNDGAGLPAPLTIATDQALYSQGDWNFFDKQPASFLADTIAVLSNNCLNIAANLSATANLPGSLAGQINCGSISGRPVVATSTRINAAFLSRTDSSDSSATPRYYGGGLNNYMRILENWTGRAMNYTGSFISLGAPQEVSGRYRDCNVLAPTANYACPPNRNWSYDTSFNSYQGLPPLPPKVTELQQDSFRRKYN